MKKSIKNGNRLKTVIFLCLAMGIFILPVILPLPRQDSVKIENNINLNISAPPPIVNYSTGNGRGVHVSGNVAYVVNYDTGLVCVNVSDPANPAYLGEYDTGTGRGVHVSGDVAYVADNVNGLVCVDVSDPANPAYLGGYDTGIGRGVHVSGDVAYVADYYLGLVCVNVSDPANPAYLGEYDTGFGLGVHVSGDVAYVADGTNGLVCVDVSDPANPTYLGFYSMGEVRGVHVSGDVAYAAVASYGLRCVDVSDPANPAYLSGYYTGYGYGVHVSGDVAYVAAASYGLVCVDVSDPANPAYLEEYDTGDGNGVHVSGDVAYVADGTNGLVCVNVSVPANPSYLGGYDTGIGRGVHVSGDVAYVADSLNGLACVNVSDPANPAYLEGYDTGVGRGVHVSGDVAYVADETNGLVCVDVSDPANPAYLGGYDMGDGRGVHVSGDVAYVAAYTSGLACVDVSDPANPAYLGGYDTGVGHGVYVSGDVAYVADEINGLVCVNVSDPANPAYLGEYDTGTGRGVHVSGDVAYVADYTNGLVCVDVSNPANPAYLGGYATGDGIGVHVSGDVAYVADYTNGLVCVDVSDPANPAYLGEYDTGFGIGVHVSGDVAYVADVTNGLVCVKVRECGSDDFDSDGLGYLQEVLNYGTDPHDNDSDDDSYDDGIEIQLGTDPLDPNDHPKPTSNNPGPIVTSAGGSEIINWTLLDDYGTGQYRVLANDTNGDFYVCQDWQSWDNNSAIIVLINRSAPGIFNYTIEYNNSNNKFGIPNTVIVTISDSDPTSSNPGSITTSAGGSETIEWTLLDDYGTGQYRVLANDTNGDFYVWRDWQPWDNGIALNVSINRSLPGIFNYTIEYNDTLDQFGLPNTVIVTIPDSDPTSSNPGPITTYLGDSDNITLILYDDFGGSHYRVLVNDSNGYSYVWQDWATWTSGVALSIPINRSAFGVYYYTIEYNTTTNQFGTPVVVVLTVSSGAPSGNGPGLFDWLTLENILLLIGIIIPVIGSVLGVVLVRKKRRSRRSYPAEVPQKLEAITGEISEEFGEKTSKIGKILGFMMEVGEAISKGDLVKAFHFTLDEAEEYLKTLDSSVSYKKSEISEIKARAEEALQQFTEPTLYDLVVKLGFDHVTAMKVGNYLTKTGVISKFSKIQAKETEVQLKPAPLEKMVLEIKRGGDWAIEGGQSIFKYKVKVHNSSEFILTNIKIHLTSIPRSLEVESELYKIEHLRPHSYESPTFRLRARESCVGDVIEGVISYIDSLGKQHTETIEPLKIEYVCNLLTPKQVTEVEYKHNTASMDERELILDSDLAPDELEKELAAILQDNNFFLLDKVPEPIESEVREFKGYAEGKYDKEDVGLSVVMQQMADQTTTVVIKAMSDREEKLVDLLRDINVKCDDIKSCNELVLEYSMRIEKVMDKIENLEEFLITHLGKDFEQIKHVWSKFKSGEMGKTGLIAEGAKILGKRFLKIFTGMLS